MAQNGSGFDSLISALEEEKQIKKKRKRKKNERR
jgi:hypothetical protein